MKELDLAVFVAVFQEMLGWTFWPLVVFIVAGALAFLAILIRERGLDARRLVIAEVIGLAGGFAGIWVMLAATGSSLPDVFGGPIDWLLTLAIWVAGAIGAAIASYVVLGLIRPRRIAG